VGTVKYFQCWVFIQFTWKCKHKHITSVAYLSKSPENANTNTAIMSSKIWNPYLWYSVILTTIHGSRLHITFAHRKKICSYQISNFLRHHRTTITGNSCFFFELSFQKLITWLLLIYSSLTAENFVFSVFKYRCTERAQTPFCFECCWFLHTIHCDKKFFL